MGEIKDFEDFKILKLAKGKSVEQLEKMFKSPGGELIRREIILDLQRMLEAIEEMERTKNFKEGGFKTLEDYLMTVGMDLKTYKTIKLRFQQLYDISFRIMLNHFEKIERR